MRLRSHAVGLMLIAILAGGCGTLVPPSRTAEEDLGTSTPQVERSDRPTLTATPVPTPLATMAPPPPKLVTVEPVEGTTLPLAARDGAPGLVACADLRPTTLEAIHASPSGAETRIGPEYDVLRATIERYGDDTEFGFRGQTFREFRLDATHVTFLGSNDEPEGPFSSIEVDLEDGRWGWAGMDGGCMLTGVPGRDWGMVNWVLDEDHEPPVEETRTLHLLATDHECVGDAHLVGRLAPAWVFLQPRTVQVQLFSKRVERDAECTDQEPTKVTVRLPEPLGGRELVDANPPPCRGCGG